MYQYSGPGTPQVLDNLGNQLGRHIHGKPLVISWYVVDGRGTGGRGEAFEKCTPFENRSQGQRPVETALYLGKQAYVDKDRIGIRGWS